MIVSRWSVVRGACTRANAVAVIWAGPEIELLLSKLAIVQSALVSSRLVWLVVPDRRESVLLVLLAHKDRPDPASHCATQHVSDPRPDRSVVSYTSPPIVVPSDDRCNRKGSPVAVPFCKNITERLLAPVSNCAKTEEAAIVLLTTFARQKTEMVAADVQSANRPHCVEPLNATPLAPHVGDATSE